MALRAKAIDRSQPGAVLTIGKLAARSGARSRARTALEAVVDKLGPDRVEWRDVDALEELDDAVALGMLSQRLRTESIRRLAR
jgi:hypothetical protein